MANTTLANVAFVPEAFAQWVREGLFLKSDILSTTVVRRVGASIPLYGYTVTFPVWNGIDGSASNAGACIVPDAFQQHTQVAPILRRQHGISVGGIVSDVTRTDPMADLTDEVIRFWQRDIQKNLIASAKGSSAALEADFPGKIVYNASASVISSEDMIMARGLFGEYQNDASYLIVHSAIYSRLQANELTEFMPGADGRQVMFWQGMRVVMADGVPNTGGVYDSYIARSDAFLYDENTEARKEVETDRDILCDVDQMTLRKNYIIHPVGAKWVGTPSDDLTPTTAELAVAANWDKGTSDALGYRIRVLKARAVTAAPAPTPTPSAT